jgi:hypothetical protein
MGAYSEQELTMPNWIDEQAQRQRFDDMIGAARRDHMANIALAARVQRTRFYSPILAQLGRWLESWGYRLQTRYGSKATIATETPGSSSRC